MNRTPVVSDSSPLIALERIAHLHLLPALFEKVVIPSAVRLEVYGNRPLPEWTEEIAIKQTLTPRMIAARLGLGESEAIALALELDAEELLLDDLAARRLATSLGVPMIGTLGLLLRAKQHGLIPQVKPVLEALRQGGFHISERMFDGILLAATGIE